MRKGEGAVVLAAGYVCINFAWNGANCFCEHLRGDSYRDSRNGFASDPLLLDPVCEFLDDGIGEHFAGDAFYLCPCTVGREPVCQ
jgi:hypothetical protein